MKVEVCSCFATGEEHEELQAALEGWGRCFARLPAVRQLSFLT